MGKSNFKNLITKPSAKGDGAVKATQKTPMSLRYNIIFLIRKLNNDPIDL